MSSMSTLVHDIRSAHSQDLDDGHEEDDGPSLLPELDEVLSSDGSPCVHLDAIFLDGLLERSSKALWARHRCCWYWIRMKTKTMRVDPHMIRHEIRGRNGQIKTNGKCYGQCNRQAGVRLRFELWLIGGSHEGG